MAKLHAAPREDESLGAGVMIAFERTRIVPGLTWRAEFGVVSHAASRADAGDTGTLRHNALLGHLLYVRPGATIEPYAGVGLGPLVRAASRRSDAEPRVGAQAALSAGMRMGSAWRRVFLEVRTAAALAGRVEDGRSLQYWSQLLIGGSFDFRPTPPADPAER